MKNQLSATAPDRQAGWAAAIEKAAALVPEVSRLRHLLFPPGSTARFPGIRW